MRNTIVSTLGALAASCVFATPALAQLQQPRCEGFPPTLAGQGLNGAGMLVGAPGVKCYGQVLNRLGGDVELVGLRVRQGPASGRFVVTGVRDFEFTPAAGSTGIDSIVLDLEYRTRGAKTTTTLAYRLATPDSYARAGGTPTRLPPQFIAR